MARRVVLEFACDSDELLTGLGQHEDGVYQYQGKKEYLYQNNMIISLPFLLSSAGYGVLIDAECAMRFESDEPGKFRFILEAVEDFGLTVPARMRRSRGGAHALRAERRNAAAAALGVWLHAIPRALQNRGGAGGDVVRRFRSRKSWAGLHHSGLAHMAGKPLGRQDPRSGALPLGAGNDGRVTRAARTSYRLCLAENMAKGGQDHAEFEAAHQFLPNCDTYDAFNPDARRLYAEQC